jgi:serine/threonine protein kinase
MDTLINQPPSIGKKYTINQLLARGKFGKVFLAEDKTGEKYALKQSIWNQTNSIPKSATSNPPPKNGSSGLSQQVETIKHEAEMLTFLASASKNCRLVIPFVTWYGLCSQGNYCLLMSYIPHTPLTPTSIRPSAKGEPPQHNLLQMMHSITQALKTIHEQGILHRDLKPENILYHHEKRRWMLIDFGLSTFYKDEDGKHRPPASKPRRSLLGTPNFVSTFLHNGEEPSRRDDLIALANVAWWLAQGGTWLLPQVQKEQETLEKIVQIKKQISTLALQQTPVITKESGLDQRLVAFFHHCYGLGYADTPSYPLLVSFLTV